MDITREINRVDFVKQPDGSVIFSVGIVEIAADPFSPGKMLRRKIGPSPMTPQMAQELFGFSMSDIVDGINEAVAQENAALKGEIAALRATIETSLVSPGES